MKLQTLAFAFDLTKCLLLELAGPVLLPVGPVWRLEDDIPSGKANLGKGLRFQPVGSFLSQRPEGRCQALGSRFCPLAV